MNWLFAHFVGDFFLPDDWMAEGKKKSSWVCLVHVLMYMLPFLFIGSWIGLPFGSGELVYCETEWWKLMLIAVQHFFQDRTGFVEWWLRFKGSVWFSKSPMAPWSIILTDNMIHLMWIAFVMSL